jgi:SNF2 family DNA or RNA helicase
MTITCDGSNFHIQFPFDNKVVEAVRMLPGRRWHKESKTWRVPVRYAGHVFDFAINFGADVSEQAAEIMANIEAEHPDEFGGEVDAGDLTGIFGTRRLYNHQRLAVKFLLNKRKAILADDMGLGKTLSALVAAQKTGLPIHVICPASLMANWRREAVMAGVLVNSVWSWAKLPDNLSIEKHVLIVDEAHYAQGGWKTKRGERFLALCDRASFVYLLTGTPLKNGQPINFMPLLQAIKHPQVANAREYQKFYCNARATRWSKWDCSGAAHLDILHDRTKDKMLRRTKDECLDLPPKTRVMVPASVSDIAMKRYADTYKKLKDDYRARVARGDITGGAEGLVLMSALSQATSLGKVETAVEMAEEMVGQGKSVVIYTAYLETKRAISAGLNGGVNVASITGDVPLAVRDEIVQKFQAGEIKVLVATYGAGGVGITLTKSQDVILVDRPWTPGDTIQAEDRLHRIGQRNAVTSYWVQWPYGGMDEMIDAILDKKQERIELVLHGQRKTLRGTESVGDVGKMVAESMLSEEPDLF